MFLTLHWDISQFQLSHPVLSPSVLHLPDLSGSCTPRIVYHGHYFCYIINKGFSVNRLRLIVFFIILKTVDKVEMWSDHLILAQHVFGLILSFLSVEKSLLPAEVFEESNFKCVYNLTNDLKKAQFDFWVKTDKLTVHMPTNETSLILIFRHVAWQLLPKCILMLSEVNELLKCIVSCQT